MQQQFKGDTPNQSFFLFDLPFLILAAFQVALHHPLVELFSEFVKEIGATVVLSTLHVHINVLAVLDFYIEDFG